MSPPPAARPSSPLELFVTFTLLALQGFGGVLAVTQRELCDRRRWLTHREFVEMLSFGQVLPGPNVTNLALMVGGHFFGMRGAFAALAGMLCVPLAIVLTMAALYVEFASLPAVAGALRGMAAVSAGLIVGVALRLAGSLRGTPLGSAVALALALVTFIAVAWLRYPLAAVLLVLGTIGTVIAWRRIAAQLRREAGE